MAKVEKYKSMHKVIFPAVGVYSINRGEKLEMNRLLHNNDECKRYKRRKGILGGWMKSTSCMTNREDLPSLVVMQEF